MENLITFEACCKITGDDPMALPIVNHLPEKRAIKSIADHKLPIIIEAINNCVPADWANANETKYSIIFRVIKDNTRPSGFRLSYYVCCDSNAYAYVSSRLTFRTLEGLRHAVENFLPEFENAYL